jgi:Uncharacterized conserved protein
MTFCLELSIELLANHKYLNIWLIISNLFAAYGIWRLWLVRPVWLRFATWPAVLCVSAAIVTSGLIDLFPIHNSFWIQLKYRDDALIKWVRENTKPHDIFLSDRFVNHSILLAGRRIFYGWPSFSWSAGYDTTRRDNEYRELFESNDPYAVFRLLQKHKIAYVAIDDGVRRSDFINRNNEKLYAMNLRKVWEDKTNQYGSLIIYKVPQKMPRELKRPSQASLQTLIANAPAVTMFQGGRGAGRGQFDFPRGMTVDAAGNVLIADTNNGRIEKFSATGIFIASLGTKGRGRGELAEPNAVAVDQAGNMYVTETFNHRVQKLAPDGRFLTEWKGPEPGFYGPRKIALGPDDSVYVVDQGRARLSDLATTDECSRVGVRKGKGKDSSTIQRL